MRVRGTKPFYILIDLVFALLYAGVLITLYYLGRIPQTVRVLDLILLALAVARITDVISTDEVMRWLREPFVETEPEEVAGREVQTRRGRGRGLRRVLGQLLACPWCVGVWVAAGLTYVYFLLPSMVWLFVLIMALSEIGSLVQTFSTILVRLSQYLKSVCGTEEGL